MNWTSTHGPTALKKLDFYDALAGNRCGMKLMATLVPCVQSMMGLKTASMISLVVMINFHYLLLIALRALVGSTTESGDANRSTYKALNMDWPMSRKLFAASGFPVTYCGLSAFVVWDPYNRMAVTFLRTRL